VNFIRDPASTKDTKCNFIVCVDKFILAVEAVEKASVRRELQKIKVCEEINRDASWSMIHGFASIENKTFCPSWVK